MIRRPPRSSLDRSSAASDVYKRQGIAMVIRRRFLLVRALAGTIAVFIVTAGLVSAEVIERDRAAGEVAGAFVKELGAAMMREMAKGGPTEAVKVLSLIHISEPTRPY